MFLKVLFIFLTKSGLFKRILAGFLFISSLIKIFHSILGRIYFIFNDCICGMVHRFRSHWTLILLIVCLSSQKILMYWVRSGVDRPRSIGKIFTFVIVLYLLIKFFSFFPCNINISLLFYLIVLLFFGEIFISGFALVYDFSNLALFIFLNPFKLNLRVKILLLSPGNKFILNLFDSAIFLQFPL